MKEARTDVTDGSNDRQMNKETDSRPYFSLKEERTRVCETEIKKSKRVCVCARARERERERERERREEREKYAVCGSAREQLLHRRGNSPLPLLLVRLWAVTCA